MSKIEKKDRLLRRLAAMRDGPRKAISAVLGEEGPALADAIRNVAHGKRLKASIGWSWGNAPEGAGLSSGNRTEEKALLGAQGLAVTIHAGSREAFWARWEEFGTKPHKNKGLFEGTDHPGTAPRPFFFPTFRLRRKGILSRISRAMREAIKIAVRRA